MNGTDSGRRLAAYVDRGRRRRPAALVLLALLVAPVLTAVGPAGALTGGEAVGRPVAGPTPEAETLSVRVSLLNHPTTGIPARLRLHITGRLYGGARSLRYVFRPNDGSPRSGAVLGVVGACGAPAPGAAPPRPTAVDVVRTITYRYHRVGIFLPQVELSGSASCYGAHLKRSFHLRVGGPS